MSLAISPSLRTSIFDLSLIKQVKLKNEIHKKTSIVCDKKNTSEIILGFTNNVITDIKTVIIKFGFQFILDIKLWKGNF